MNVLYKNISNNNLVHLYVCLRDSDRSQVSNQQPEIVTIVEIDFQQLFIVK